MYVFHEDALHLRRYENFLCDGSSIGYACENHLEKVYLMG